MATDTLDIQAPPLITRELLLRGPDGLYRVQYVPRVGMFGCRSTERLVLDWVRPGTEWPRDCEGVEIIFRLRGINPVTKEVTAHKPHFGREIAMFEPEIVDDETVGGRFLNEDGEPYEDVVAWKSLSEWPEFLKEETNGK